MRTIRDYNMNQKAPRLNNLVEQLVVEPKKKIVVRFVGPTWAVVRYWFTIKSKVKGRVSIPKQCLDYDPTTDTFTDDTCPYRLSGLGREDKVLLTNVIDRREQERAPRNPIGPTEKEREPKKWQGWKAIWKDGKSESYTPVRVLEISQSLFSAIQTELDVLGAKISLADPEDGRDIELWYDPDRPAMQRWRVRILGKTPLTREERRYPLWRLDVLKPDPLPLAKKEMRDLSEKIVSSDKDGRKRQADDDTEADETYRVRDRRRSDDEDDDDDAPRRRSRDDDDEDADDTPRRARSSRDDDDLDADEDEAPRRRSRDDDDEDDAPRRAARSSRDDDDEDDAPRRRPRDDDDDGGFDDDDDDGDGFDDGEDD